MVPATTPTAESFGQPSSPYFEMVNSPTLKSLASISSSSSTSTMTCKILHAASSTNFVIKMARSIRIGALRAQLEIKFLDSAGIRLEGDRTSLESTAADDGQGTALEAAASDRAGGWQLAILCRKSGESDRQELEVIWEQEQLDRAIEGAGEKITLRIV